MSVQQDQSGYYQLLREWATLKKEALRRKIALTEGKVAYIDPEHESEWLKCKYDVSYWVDTYCYTYDPRLLAKGIDPFVPFKLFNSQKECLEFIKECEQSQEPGLIEKSRDMGVTYLCSAYLLHGWIFRSGFSGGIGSRKLELVDKIGDTDSIFEKVRIMYRRLPSWQIPPLFKSSDHDNFARLINPNNQSTITGEGGDDIGRGGRKTIYIVDEAAFLEHPKKVDASLSQTTSCRIDVSTPNGPGNNFYSKRFSGNIKVFTMHWKSDPRKGVAWYEKQKKIINDPVIVAQEIDIDYTASIEGICIPAIWVQSAVNLKLPHPSEITLGLDIAAGGHNRSVLFPRKGPVVYMPTVYNCGTTKLAHEVKDIGERLHASILYYDVGGVGLGFKDALSSMEVQPLFDVKPINSGDSPSEGHYANHSNKDLFFNLRSELWWKLRKRFENTFEYVTQNIEHSPDEMISIPNCAELIAQLSLPLVDKKEDGKIQLESKLQMKKRGIASPDYADSLVLSFAPGGPVISYAKSDVVAVPFTSDDTIQKLGDVLTVEEAREKKDFGYDNSGRLIIPKGGLNNPQFRSQSRNYR